MIPGAVHSNLLAFALQLRNTPENLNSRPSDEGVMRPVIALNGVSYLKMRSVGSHSTSGRKKVGKKERTGNVLSSQEPSRN
jgi:hypothetical protein